MIRSDFHTHTVYCDGGNTPAEMAAAAKAQGMRALGICCHSHTPFDPDVSIAIEKIPDYAAEVRAEQARYRGQMEVYLGVEDDICGSRPEFSRDYTIGSVHYLKADGQYYSVDDQPEILQELANVGFGGDYYRLAAAYFRQLAEVQSVTRCDFVGHFDLLTKFNEDGRLFDETDPRYRRPALEALEALCRQGSVLEINTGAISRGYRAKPYPADWLLKAAREFGGAIVISSDAHCTQTLRAAFPEAEALARACGFRSRRVLTAGRWQEVALESDL